MRGVRDWIFFKTRHADYEEEELNELATFIKSFSFSGHSTFGPFTNVHHSHYTQLKEPEPLSNPNKNGPLLVQIKNQPNFAVPITPAHAESFVKTAIKMQHKPP